MNKNEAINNNIIKNTRAYKFIKVDGAWYVDLPQYILQGGDSAFLEMKEGAEEVLRIIARGKSAVTILMDTEPFEGADKLELEELCLAPKGGGYYRMHTCRGKAFHRRIWICDITLFIFGDMPQYLYVHKIILELESK